MSIGRKKVLLVAAIATLILLTSAIIAGLVQAKPLTSGYNKKFYDNFVERLLVDFRRAGFVVVKEKVKDTPSREQESVVETEVKIVKVSESFQKYFGQLKLKNFFVQGEERSNAFTIYLWVRYETGVNYIIFSYRNDPFADYEKKMEEAKKELIAYLFGKDCGTQYYGGFTQTIGSRFISSSQDTVQFSTANNKEFSKDARKFLSNFYRGLKDFGFRFTLVENPPVSEIRIFGFPKAVSIFLPDPETKLIAVRSKAIGSGEGMDIDIFNRNERKFETAALINFSSGDTAEQLSEFAVKKLFEKFYMPDCALYGGM